MPPPIPKTPWSSISLDFIVKLPKSEGFDSILVTADRFTKMAHFSTCTEKINAVETIRLLMEYVFKLHSLPDIIISDRGPQVTATLWKEILAAFQIQKRLSTLIICKPMDKRKELIKFLNNISVVLSITSKITG
jgi:hypothetical protein